MLGVIGPNGAGKSTLINLICSLIQPTAGIVRISTGSTLGWAPQRTLVDWSLTVEENVRLPAVGGLPTDGVDEVLRLLDLHGVRDREAETLSGGQLQRVQVARALAYTADIYVLDEPCAGLDPEASDAVMSELRSRANNGAMVVVSSHDLAAIENCADQVLLIEDGEVHAPESVTGFSHRDDETARELVVSFDTLDASDARRLVAEGWEVDAEANAARVLVAANDDPIALLSKLPGDVVTDVRMVGRSLRQAYLQRGS